MAGDSAVEAKTRRPQACWYGLVDQGPQRAPTGAAKPWPGWPASDRKGVNRPSGPWAQQRGWPLRLFGPRAWPGGVPKPIRLAVENGNGHRQLRRRPQACLAAGNRELSLAAVQTKRIERAASAATWAWTWAQRGARARGPPPWAIAKGRQPMGARPGAPPPHWQWPGSLDLLHSRDPAQALPSARSGGLRALFSTCLSPAAATRPVRLRRPTTQNGQTLVPQAWILGQPGLTVGHWSPHGGQRASTAWPGWPWNWAAARGRSGPAQRCHPASLPAAGGRPRSGRR